jgi:hypothetical protein
MLLRGMTTMATVSRRDLLKYTAAGAGALVLSSSRMVALARVAPGHCGWGAFAEPVGKQTPMQAVYEMEKLIGRKLDVTRHYLSWDRDIPNEQVKESARTGHIPLISWECQRRDGSSVKWADIASGRHDNQLKDKAHALRDWGHKAYFVFNHEPENDTFSGNAAEFKAAYDHTRKVFDNAGANNLRWVCTLMRPTFQGAHGGVGMWVPSGAQAMGVDGYNRGDCNPDVGWQTFQQLFAAARWFCKNHHTKLIVQEWGTVGRTSCGADLPVETKATWIKRACERIKLWPEVETVIYTNADANFHGENFSYRVDTSPDALKVYRKFGKDPYFAR